MNIGRLQNYTKLVRGIYGNIMNAGREICVVCWVEGGGGGGLKLLPIGNT